MKRFRCDFSKTHPTKYLSKTELIKVRVLLTLIGFISTVIKKKDEKKAKENEIIPEVVVRVSSSFFHVCVTAKRKKQLFQFCSLVFGYYTCH